MSSLYLQHLITLTAASVITVMSLKSAAFDSGPMCADDESGHRSLLVDVAPGVKLEVLDWSRSGTPMVLLAGLGNTAHVFDDFAHRFTPRFRVIGSRGEDSARRATQRLATTRRLSRTTTLRYSILWGSHAQCSLDIPSPALN